MRRWGGEFRDDKVKEGGRTRASPARAVEIPARRAQPRREPDGGGQEVLPSRASPPRCWTKTEPAARALRGLAHSVVGDARARRPDCRADADPLQRSGGPQRFRRRSPSLMRGGNAYFIKNAKREHRLMAENIKTRPATGGFQSAATARPRASSASSGRGHPIAVLVPKVAAQKRLDVERWSRVAFRASGARRREADRLVD